MRSIISTNQAADMFDTMDRRGLGCGHQQFQWAWREVLTQNRRVLWRMEKRGVCGHCRTRN